VLATQSIKAQAREEGRVSLYNWIVYKRGSKARERKEKNSSAAQYFIRSLSYVTYIYHNPHLPKSTVFHQRRNITPPSEKACP